MTESGHDDAGALRVEAHRGPALFQRLGGQTFLDGRKLSSSDDGLVHTGGVVGFHGLADAHDARGRAATATTRSMANPAVAKPSKYGAMVSRIH